MNIDDIKTRDYTPRPCNGMISGGIKAIYLVPENEFPKDKNGIIMPLDTEKLKRFAIKIPQ